MSRGIVVLFWNVNNAKSEFFELKNIEKEVSLVRMHLSLGKIYQHYSLAGGHIGFLQYGRPN